MPYLLLLSVFVFSGCSSLPKKQLRYSAQPFSPEAKIFLVAGSPDSANFAQEIVDQKRLWISRGVSAKEISCYFALPSNGLVWEDEEQFFGLSDELAHCHPASAKLLLSHLSQSLSKKPRYIYLYVTSHGEQPFKQKIEQEPDESRKKELIATLEKYPFLNSYHLNMTSVASGWNITENDLEEVAKGAKTVSDVTLTPQDLASVLREGDAKTKKIVVLQGCYSGGFIENPQGTTENTIAGVPNLIALTASNSTSVSFGCSPGAEKTYYGQEFERVLKFHFLSPNAIDWKKFYQLVKMGIESREISELGPNTPSSHPLYFSSKQKSFAR